MECYFIVDTYIDANKGRGLYDEYIQKVKPIVEGFGGEYLVRTEQIISLHSLRNPQRVIIIRFPSRQALETVVPVAPVIEDEDEEEEQQELEVPDVPTEEKKEPEEVPSAVSEEKPEQADNESDDTEEIDAFTALINEQERLEEEVAEEADIDIDTTVDLSKDDTDEDKALRDEYEKKRQERLDMLRRSSDGRTSVDEIYRESIKQRYEDESQKE